MPGKWKEWDYSKLEPKGSLRYVTNNDEPNHAKSKSNFYCFFVLLSWNNPRLQY